MIDSELIADVEQAARRRMAHRSAPWTADDVEELAAFNDACGNRSGAAAARVLADGKTLCVMTGQQAGLLCGPLYTLYKALGALVLAEQMQERLDRRVLAGFWVASDDHDFEEIRSVTWQDKNDTPRRFSFEASIETGAISAHSIPLGDGIEALFEAIEESTHPGELRDSVLERLREAAKSSKDLEDFFCRCLTMLLGEDSGMILVSPRLQCVQRVQAEVLAPEFAEPLRSTRLLLESGKAFETRGQKAPIHRRPDDVNCFLYEGQTRAHLSFIEKRFVTSHPKTRDRLAAYSADEMRALLDASPERFSPNVATRSIVQDARFPTVAYVAGPSEKAYSSQIEPLYEFFNVCWPAVVRRPGGVLIEPRVARALEKLEADVEQYLTLGSERWMAEHAKKQKGRPPARIARAEKEVSRLIDALASEAEGADPAIVKGIEKLRASLTTGFNKLEQRAAAALSREDATARDRCRRIDQSLRPWGQPQERTYTAFFPFYSHYGAAFSPTLRSCFAEGFGAEQVLALSDPKGSVAEVGLGHESKGSSRL